MNAPAAPVVWVHSSFRVSSTWIWWRFRQCANAVAYCEIFNEALAELDAAKIPANTYRDWNSGHPPSAPYNLEYLPLLADGGRLAFEPEMAYDRFIPTAADGAISEAEARYVATLIDKATELGRIPVLTAVRSLGRVHGLRRRFGGFHILWYRNLWRQWCSYSSQEILGNSYFNDRLDRVLARNGHDRFLATLVRMFPPGEGRARVGEPRHFVRFVLLHLYLYVTALPDCDLLVSVDRLAEDGVYRAEIAEQVRAASGIALDLDGCRAGTEFAVLPLETRSEWLETVRVTAGMIASFLPAWSAAQERLLRTLIGELDDEVERYAFYTGRLLRYAKGGLADLPAARATLDAQPALRGERDRLQAQCEALAQERARLQSELDAARADAGEMRAHLKAAQQRIAQAAAEAAQRDAALAQARAEAERTGSVLAEARRARDENDRRASQTQADADAVRTQLVQAHGELAQLQAQRGAARDALAAMHASRSWRLTRPLRLLSGRLRGR